MRGAVGANEGAVSASTPLRVVQLERTIKRPRVRVHEQLGMIESMPLVRCPGPVRAQSVARARLNTAHEAVEDRPCALRERNALDLAVAGGIEEAEIDARRVLREDGDVGAICRQPHPERCRAPGAHARHG